MFSTQPGACGNRAADSPSGWVTNSIKNNPSNVRVKLSLCRGRAKAHLRRSRLEREYQTRARDLTGAESRFRKRSHDLNVRAGFVNL